MHLTAPRVVYEERLLAHLQPIELLSSLPRHQRYRRDRPRVSRDGSGRIPSPAAQ